MSCYYGRTWPLINAMYGGVAKVILVLEIKALREDLMEHVLCNAVSQISVHFGAQNTVTDLLLVSAS